MREIKFRGFREYDKKWIYGNLVILKNGESAIVPAKKVCRDGHHVSLDMDDLPTWFDETTIGQYTGLKDKNGKEIYEGDILKRTLFPRIINYSVVKWISLKACLASVDIDESAVTFISDYINCDYELEIIGNIYENPELLGSGQK